MMPTGKATAAAPKLSDEGHVELEDMLPASPDPPEDIMQLARLGDIQGIERLYASGKFDAAYHDDEGITPLHVIPLSLLQDSFFSCTPNIYPVGCDQQPICNVPVSFKGRS